MIEQWFKNETLVLRAFRGNAKGLRAATGTNAALHAYALSRNLELAGRLVKRLEDPKETNYSRLSALGKSLTALAARLEPREAGSLAGRLVKPLEDPKETDFSRLSALQELLTALAARLEAREAASLAGRLVKRLENPNETNADRLQTIWPVLESLTLRIPIAPQTQLLALSQLLLRQIPGPGAKSEQPGNERKLVVALCELLAPRDLAEAVKWPFTGGEAEKIVLASLDKKTGKQFGGDVWKFVEQAESLGIKNIGLPAKRPRLEDARRELAVLRENTTN
ncbi:MAG: hypothetical protein ACRERU_01485 [Methylococcales bacterium]